MRPRHCQKVVRLIFLTLVFMHGCKNSQLSQTSETAKEPAPATNLQPPSVAVANPTLAAASRVQATNMAPAVRTTPRLVLQLGHSSFVEVAVFSSDGRFVVTGGDYRAILWDATMGIELQRFVGHTGEVTAVALSPDARLLATGSTDKTARLWDVATGKEIRRFGGQQEAIRSVAFSPNGSFVRLEVGSGTIDERLWEVATGKGEVVKRSNEEQEGHLQFSADGHFAVTGIGSHEAWLQEVATGKRVQRLGNFVFTVAFSLDGRFLTTGDLSGTVELWDLATGKIIQKFAVEGGVVHRIVFSPDSRFVFTESSHTGWTSFAMQIWEVKTGKEKISLPTQADRASAVAFSPDSRFLVMVNGEHFTAHLWDMEIGKELRKFEGHHSLQSASFSPDGRYLVMSQGLKEAWSYETVTGAVIQKFTSSDVSGVGTVAFSPDRRMLVSGGVYDSDHLWDITASKGQGLTAPVKQTLTVPGIGVEDIAFSTDGRFVVTGNQDKTARVWETATGKEVQRFSGHAEAVTTVAFSPDGQLVLTGTRKDGTVRLWEVTTGKEKQRFTTRTSMYTLTFSLDGRFVLIGGDGNVVQIWDVATAKEIQQPLENEIEKTMREMSLASGTYFSELVAFSPDGRFMVGIPSGDSNAWVWEVATGKIVQKFSVHTGEVVSVTFSADSRFILTGHPGVIDGTARVWEVATGREVQQIGNIDDVYGKQVMAMSPDARYLVTSTIAGLSLWEVATGGAIRQFEDAEAPMAFSPDGRFIVARGRDVTVRLWEAATGKEVQRFAGHAEGVTVVIFSPDGRFVLTGSRDYTVRLWEVATGKETRRFRGHTDSVTAMAFSPDGRFIVTGGRDETVRLWETTAGKEVWRVKDQRSASSLSFSPDGRFVLTGSRRHPIQMRDIATGKEMPLFLKDVLEASESVYPDIHGVEAFSADGRFVITTRAGGSIQLWEVATGKEIQRFSGTEELRIFYFAVLSPDRRILVTMDDKQLVQLWEVATGNEIRRFEEEQGGVSSSVAFSPDSRFIVIVGEDHIARLREVATGKVIRQFTDVSRKAVFSPDGRFLAIGSLDRDARFWEVKTGTEVLRLSGDTGDTVESASTGTFTASVAFSPDGHFLVTGSSDNIAQLWEVTPGKVVQRFIGHTGNVLASAISPDSHSVLTGSGDNSARLWDRDTGKEIQRFTGHTAPLYAVTFSSDGRFVMTASVDGTVRRWAVDSGKEVQQFRVFPDLFSSGSSGLPEITFSPDGRFVLTASGDHIPQLWDVGTGKIVQRFTGHTAEVSALAFSPDTDSRFVVTASRDLTVRLWEVTSGKELWQFAGSEMGSLAFSYDARTVITVDGASVMHFLNVATGQERCRLISFHDGTWVVVDPQGHFDTNNFDNLSGLHWVMPDDPFSVLPLDIFMRQYYEPRLLARLLAGEKLPEPKNLTLVNRAQPEIRNIAIKEQSQASDLVTVTVMVAKGERPHRRGGVPGVDRTGVYDLRLFRDGQLVGQEPEEGGEVHLETDDTATVQFSNIRLPHRAEGAAVEFSAYAFNVEQVKSNTRVETYKLPRSLPPRRVRVYIISVGVNAYGSGLALRYAVADAQLIGSTVAAKLKGEYEVIALSLLSDYREQDGKIELTQQTATKAHFQAVLARLAGQEADSQLLAEIPGAQDLQPALPEDLVLLSFSGHGYDHEGQFYLVASDMVPTGRKEISRTWWEAWATWFRSESSPPTADTGVTKLSAYSISSTELSRWLRHVDAGELVLIIDACHSAAAVRGPDFKPAPMNSRGLGQLSYDKGMRILAATQKDSLAWEDGGKGQGLLTYALIKDGLERGQADFQPQDQRILEAEWLAYGVKQVPILYEEIRQKKSKLAVHPGEAADEAQIPELFDFRRKGQDITLTTLR